MSFGSAQRLLEELDSLNEWLKLPGDYGELGDEEAWKYYEDENNPWRFVNWCWIVMHWLAREAIRQRLCLRVGD